MAQKTFRHEVWTLTKHFVKNEEYGAEQHEVMTLICASD